MAFNSIHFLVFFPIVLVLYHAIPHAFRWLWLLAASLYFYAVWRPPYLLLLLAAIVFTYYLAILIEDAQSESRKRHYLSISLLGLLGNLFIFKYFNFFNDSVRDALHPLGLSYPLGALDLLLPIGISFYTFQKVAYLIDIYRGKQKAERHAGIFTLFASFWPQLVAGPIERASNLLPQFRERHEFDYDQVSSGLRLMAWGFFKKIVVADRLASFVNQVYGDPQRYGAPALLLATLFFAFQVYCDFSGYSDIAVGASRTMGFRLMANFKQPYFATSIADFWKRWHISLSTWLTDYVYTPLTRARWLKLKWYPKLLISLLLTFLVSGLWHGAAWTYVAWGALHGTYLIVSVVSQKQRQRLAKLTRIDRSPKLHVAWKMFATFSLVCISYVFFRARSVSDAVHIVTRSALGLPEFVGDLLLLRFSVLSEFVRTVGGVEFALGVSGIATVLLVDFIHSKEPGWLSSLWRNVAVRRSLDFAVLVGIILFGAFESADGGFIYFQF